jgi:hypothetical protein
MMSQKEENVEKSNDATQKKEIHPIVTELQKEGLLEDNPNINGKYMKKGNKKDINIVKWIFDHSAYADSLTSDLYVELIKANITEKSIQDYMGRFKGETR